MKPLHPAHPVSPIPSRLPGRMGLAGFASLKIEERFTHGGRTLAGISARLVRSAVLPPPARQWRLTPLGT